MTYNYAGPRLYNSEQWEEKGRTQIHDGEKGLSKNESNKSQIVQTKISHIPFYKHLHEFDRYHKIQESLCSSDTGYSTICHKHHFQVIRRLVTSNVCHDFYTASNKKYLLCKTVLTSRHLLLLNGRNCRGGRNCHVKKLDMLIRIRFNYLICGRRNCGGGKNRYTKKFDKSDRIRVFEFWLGSIHQEQV